MSFGPCAPWDPLCTSFPDNIDPALEAAALQAATEILWMRTKQQFGLCEYVLRPCATGCQPPNWWGMESLWGGLTTWPVPVYYGGGLWVNTGCGCFDDCSCGTLEKVELPYPVDSVVEVTIDGVVLDPGAYQVVDYRWLVRIDGSAWPECNDFGAVLGDEGTWSVTAMIGKPVPELGRIAVGELASQIARACGPGDCSLPAGTVTQIQRQGITQTLADTDLSTGMIGVRSADLFISTYNPNGSRSRAIVTQIDGGRKPGSMVTFP